LRARNERAELERRLADADRGAVPADAVGIARWLDDAARILAPYREGEQAGGVAPPQGAPSPLRLPPGVRPDQREGIDALRSLRPRWVLVDGHNVLGAIDHRSIGDAGARRDLVTGLGLLGRALAPAAVIVVFDSALVGARESVDAAPGVTVRFSPATSAADDVLAEEAGELGPGTVVISNDREVRERTAGAGALVLWSDALVAWLSEARREGVTAV
jgi:predicted RNA-binding protein with PIN domain